MGTFIKVVGADFSANAVSFVAPVSSGLVGWYFLGTDAAKSTRNLASGGTAASVIGTPTYSTNYVTLKGSISGTISIDTGLADTASITLLCVARMGTNFAANNGGSLIGNGGGTPDGAYLRALGSGTSTPDGRLVVGGGYSSGSLVSSGSVVTGMGSGFGFFAGVIEDGVRRTSVNKTGNSTTTTTDATARSVPAPTTLKLGAAGTTPYQGAFDMAWAAIYNRALSSGEIDTVYAGVKAYLVRRSITI